MVIKKLGDELGAEFCEVVKYLGEVEGLRVVVEPQAYLDYFAPSLGAAASAYVYSFTPEQEPRYATHRIFIKPRSISSNLL